MRQSRLAPARTLPVIAGLLAMLFLAPVANAEIRLPRIFSDDMVLQRDTGIPVWGWANPHEHIKVEFDGNKAETDANANGQWTVKLKPMPVSADPKSLQITGSSGTSLILKNVLVGEVWLGSGQSNMVMQTPDYRRINVPGNIRIFRVKEAASPFLLQDVEGRWQIADRSSLAPFSWVFYEFGQNLSKEINVPIGLIQSAWGGTSIQAWTPTQEFATDPAFANELQLINKSNADYEEAMKKATTESTAEIFAPRASTKPSTSDAQLPKHAFADAGKWPSLPTVLYNGMIYPLMPFAIRGTCWYQGENNMFDKNPFVYDLRMKAMIESWRRGWQEGDIPFYFVQLPPFAYKTLNDTTRLARFWEAQYRVPGMVPNVGIATSIDLGDPLDIHPGHKEEVGRRLALLALANTYERHNLVCSGPVYDSYVVDGNAVRVSFKNVGGGLIASDGKPLTWFQLAGADRHFVGATAQIDGNDVLVESPLVNNPIAVRFGWANIADPNLANKEGLPAPPFRTDQW